MRHRRNRDTLMHIILVPRPAGLRPVRQRSPLISALSLGTAGIMTALLFGVFISVAPVGSLFAGEAASTARTVTRTAPRSTTARVASPMVLPTVRVVASR